MKCIIYSWFILIIAAVAPVYGQPLGPRFRTPEGGTAIPVTTRGAFEQSSIVRAGNRIDEIVTAGLKQHQLQPAPLCSDEVFVRRVYLDTIGVLPTEKEVRTFLASSVPSRRAMLIDQLLAKEEFADYCALRWCDVLRVKSEFPINLWPNGAMTYYRWVHDAMRTNMPYNQFVRTLLTASGSNYRYGPANFYRAVPTKDPKTIAENVALTFLGMRTGPWPQEQQDNLAVFFSRVGYKASAEWKDETVYWIRTPLDSPNVTFPDGKAGTVSDDQDPRDVFTDWLVAPDNKAFRTCLVNRIWFWLFGRGIVHEPDDIRVGNPPVYPELVQYLNLELATSRYDMKHIFRLILNSKTYQQSSLPLAGNSGGSNDKIISVTTDTLPTGDVLIPEVIRYFAVYPIRRMDAEVLQDSLKNIFGLQIAYTSEVPEPFTYIPGRQRTILLPDSGITNSFLEMFGRATRDTGLSTDRDTAVTESQQLYLLNSSEINRWIVQYVRTIPIKGSTQMERTQSAVEVIWLTFLSRYPTPAEKQSLYNLALGTPSAEFLPDVIWAVLNTKEFQCRH